MLLDAVEGLAEGSLGETGVLVLGGPLKVRVAKVQIRLIILEVSIVRERCVAVLLGTRVDDSLGREEEIKSDLEVEAPVAGRRPDHDGRDLSGLVSVSGELLAMLKVVSLGHLGEGMRALVMNHKVRRGDNLLEAVGMGNLADVVSVTAEDENCLVLVQLNEITERGVRLHDLCFIEGNVAKTKSELFEVDLLGDTARVCEEDKGDSLLLKLDEGFAGSGDWSLSLNQDTVNVKGKGNSVARFLLESLRRHDELR